eukprot:TRINITY_DN18000_c0_g1_i1.p1 TRINITY_DN18000_c0_g1~~TRINITY_DN18000_c0_g1_i1.p1  ORF type:complete len:117 (-),score=13.98 TRINITY_DN18000_c0_g1_i1:39-389(-)
MAARVQETNTLRAQLTSWLEEQTWCRQVFSSDANFVLFRCQNETIKNFIFDRLAEQGILIRDQSKQLNLSDCLRISIGDERELSLLKQTIINSFTSEKFNTDNLITTKAQTAAKEN